MDVKIDESWKKALASEWDKPYFKELTDFVRERYRSARIFPPASRIFAAYDACPFDDVKVVILGQDPYHEARRCPWMVTFRAGRGRVCFCSMPL